MAPKKKAKTNTGQAAPSSGVLYQDKYRWGQHHRMLMAVQLAEALSWDELTVLADGGDMPRNPNKMTTVYDQLHRQMCDYIQQQNCAANAETLCLPSRRAVMDESKKWLKRLATEHNLADHKPREAHTFMAQRREHLEKMLEILVQGHVNEHGQAVPFRSLAEAYKLSKRFKEIKDKHLNVGWRWLFVLLKRVNKNLFVMVWNIKKPRDAAAVLVCTHAQVCAFALHACAEFAGFVSMQASCAGLTLCTLHAGVRAANSGREAHHIPSVLP